MSTNATLFWLAELPCCFAFVVSLSIKDENAQKTAQYVAFAWFVCNAFLRQVLL